MPSSLNGVPVIELRLDEANELLSAWACAQADAVGIRILLLKGRALSDDGLRPARTSADVDVLVDPRAFDAYCDAIVAAGWEEFPSTFASAHFTLHSRSFRRDGWPNSFDVHSEYPGFLRAPAVVFDALWATRRETAFAHRTCPVPSRAANAMVLALHSLRGTHKQERHRDELASVTAASFTAAERAELAALATATGAAYPLRDVLAAWGVAVPADPELARSAAAREWHRKTAEAEGAAASWVLLLWRAPWRQKPAIVGRALWPSHADFAIDHPEVPDRMWPQVRARIARWGRGIRRAPAALRALARR